MKKDYKSVVLLVLGFFVLQFAFGQNKQLKKSVNASIIKEHLEQNKEKFKLSSSDIEDIFISKEVYSKSTKITHSYLNQAYKGIKIHNAIVNIAIKDNKVFHATSNFKQDVSKKINTSTPVLSPEQAIGKVASHFKLGNVYNLQPIETSGSKKIYTNGGISQETIPAELVYSQLSDGSMRLCWNLSVLTLDGAHWWNVRVDAVTGQIINVNDWIVKCSFGGDHTKHGVNRSKNSNSDKEASFDLFKPNSAIFTNDGSQYNVFPFTVESPNHGSRQVISEPADINASPFGWHDTNGATGAEFTDTQGNNVIAQLDDDGNNGSGALAEGTASLDFNFPLDLTLTASESIDAATTNLFYMNNIMHDIYYQYGFDEASGNFQQNNYGKASPRTGGDRVFADSQDGSDFDNANFGTPDDGSSPRMQMFLWNTPSTVPLLTINNTSLAGAYTAVLPSTGEGDDGVGNITRPDDTAITADVVLVDDGTAVGEEGCNALINGAALSGKIAIIRRGNCAFTEKIQNAQNAGAIAVIVANHNNPDNDPDYSEYVGMYGVTTPVFTIPSIFINFTDGESIISSLNNAETVNATIINDPGILLDGSYDNVVIAHEYGHGISNRLTGGAFSSDCLIACTERDAEGRCIPETNTEQMGEGWSDWFGLMITMKASDLPTDGRGIGTYVSSQPTTGSGIRPFLYSTDTNVNPMTYATSNDTASISAPHGVGSVWCTMLWDLTWKYIEKYGFDPDIYYGTGGNNKIMQIVMDALKLQACQPGFVDGRNAILAADTAMGGEDQCMIWEVFAARGLGLNATQGSRFLRTDQTEDFTMPDPSDMSLANCTTLSAESFTSKDYRVYPNPANSELAIKASKAIGNVVIDIIDINGRKVLSKSTILSSEVKINTSSLQAGMYILRMKGDYINTYDKILIE
ncbi:T9SS-dependent M36 family metallopeptidase [uncultured Algibacter sp.]|uniref:T9SS-dependent M36 family metallopeptidase n=1 Tax=uncultured Algibacter sp. TaxID=298659 RepID=UPI00261D787B|nr:T9SS-dependent M36 family metallopeptidase [uncultured Algibacter sp.]